MKSLPALLNDCTRFARRQLRKLKQWLRPAHQQLAAVSTDAKARKLARIRPLLRSDMPHVITPEHYDFLTPQLRQQFHIVATENISAHGYDSICRDIMARYPDGLILDCGAGYKAEYSEQVVNFEIVPYPSTDVLGVGEKLPFRDGVFDAVFSLNVLEHVRDPFACAAEMARVLKPGGELYCVVPFLQPLHGYPHHYFNMTHHGLRALWEPHLQIEKQEVLPSGLPIWALTWMVRRWAEQLPATSRQQFLNMPLKDLLGEALPLLDKPWVRDLPADANRELASTTAIHARKA